MKLFDDNLANKLKKRVGQKYRPSNGTEGDIFTSYYCANCLNEEWMHTGNDNDKKCEILSNTMIFDIDLKEYPSEWQYTKEGQPTCTAFKARTC